MRWEFHNESPIYAQVMERVERMIVSGALPPGERLPSVRVFAQEAGVNPNTMQRAMQELEREGLVYAQRSNGRFVTEDTAVIKKAREKLAREHVRRYRAEMQSLGFSEKEMVTLLAGGGEEDSNELLP